MGKNIAKKRKKLALSLFVIALITIIPIVIFTLPISKSNNISGGLNERIIDEENGINVRTTKAIVNVDMSSNPTNPTYSIAEEANPGVVVTSGQLIERTVIDNLVPNTKYVLTYDWNENSIDPIDFTFQTKQHSAYYVNEITEIGSMFFSFEYELDLIDGDTTPATNSFNYELHEGEFTSPPPPPVSSGPITTPDTANDEDVFNFTFGLDNNQLTPGTKYSFLVYNVDNGVNDQAQFDFESSPTFVDPTITFSNQNINDGDISNVPTGNIDVNLNWNDLYFDALQGNNNVKVDYKFTSPDQPPGYENWLPAMKDMTNPGDGVDWVAPDQGNINQTEKLYFSEVNSPIGINYDGELHIRVRSGTSDPLDVDITSSTEWNHSNGGGDNSMIMNSDQNELISQESATTNSIDLRYEVDWNNLSQETSLTVRHKKETDSAWSSEARIEPIKNYSNEIKLYTHNLANLDSDTFYDIQLIKNGNTTTPFESYRIKTKPVKAKLDNVSTGGVSDNSIDVNYDLVINDGFDRLVYQYKKQSESTYSSEIWVENATSGSFTIPNLVSGTEYNIRVKLKHNRDDFDEIITDDQVTDLTATTSGTPPPPVQNPDIFDLINAEVQVSNNSATVVVEYNHENWVGDVSTDIKYKVNPTFYEINNPTEAENWDLIENPDILSDDRLRFNVDGIVGSEGGEIANVIWLFVDSNFYSINV